LTADLVDSLGASFNGLRSSGSLQKAANGVSQIAAKGFLQNINPILGFVVPHLRSGAGIQWGVRGIVAEFSR